MENPAPNYSDPDDLQSNKSEYKDDVCYIYDTKNNDIITLLGGNHHTIIKNNLEYFREVKQEEGLSYDPDHYNPSEDEWTNLRILFHYGQTHRLVFGRSAIRKANDALIFGNWSDYKKSDAENAARAVISTEYPSFDGIKAIYQPGGHWLIGRDYEASDWADYDADAFLTHVLGPEAKKRTLLGKGAKPKPNPWIDIAREFGKGWPLTSEEKEKKNPE